MPGRLGFTGRLSDARKNLGLLLDAMALCKLSGLEVTAELIGGEGDSSLREAIAGRGLAEAVKIVPFVERHELVRRLQTFDLFVLPSHQEGLCISALEAMACGCPVVSTRCGGPEEYVTERSGELVGFDAAEMARAIGRIVDDRSLRASLSEGARAIIDECYNPALAKKTFWKAFDETFDQAREGVS